MGPLEVSRRPHRKVPADLRMGILTYPEITHAQADALAEVAAPLKPHQRMSVYQTWTESGGAHLYAELSTGEEYHIALNGNITKMGVQDEK
jgi:hypothetical protein